MNEILAWYIFYTCPRSEKKVRDALIALKFEAFLPLKEELHYWRNRQKKLILTPLFPNYIFVRTSQSHIYKVLEHPKIVYYIGWGSTPSTISTEEIVLIKNMLVSKVDPLLENKKVLGKTAKIIDGPCSGCEGILYAKNGCKRFLIHFKNAPYDLSITVEAKNVRIIT